MDQRKVFVEEKCYPTKQKLAVRCGINGSLVKGSNPKNGGNPMPVQFRPAASFSMVVFNLGETKMKVLRSELIRLFEALGWSAASKWGPGKMKGRLGSMVSMAQDGSVDSLEDEGLTELLQSLVEANGEVEIVSKKSDLDELPKVDGEILSDIDEEVAEVQEDFWELVIEEKPEESDEEVPPQKEERERPMIVKPKKRMSLLSAGIEVLRQSEEPLKVKEIMAKIEELGLWKSLKGGKTSEASLAAGIYVSIKQKGDDSVFEKVALGTFRLRGVGVR